MQAERRAPDPDLLRRGTVAKARPVTPDQVKAARLLLGWSVNRLSARSRTSYYVVKIFEETGQVASLQGWVRQVDPLVGIRATLEAAGVEFIPENGGAAGVRLRDAEG